MERIAEILGFWFGDETDPERERRWFIPDPAFDQACKSGFLADYERAAAGELDGWKETPAGGLALILLLDQFPRNIFRGTARAFAADLKARELAKEAIEQGFDRALPPVRRAFVYLPLEHSEKLDDQEESLRLFHQLAAEYPELSGYIGYAEQHLDVIRRFGRFPHRNAVLGRTSSAEELEFLDHP